MVTIRIPRGSLKVGDTIRLRITSQVAQEDNMNASQRRLIAERGPYRIDGSYIVDVKGDWALDMIAIDSEPWDHARRPRHLGTQARQG
jgi:hypothetical protein